MTDISIGQSFNVGNESKISSQKSDFEKLNEEYSAFKQKMAKSDFSNSPVALKQELSILERMKSSAEKAGLEDKIQEVEAKIEAIKSTLSKTEVKTGSIFYKPVLHTKSSGNRSDFNEIINDCKNSRGELDGASQAIISAFGDDYLTQMPSLLRKCRNGEENISQNMVDSITKLAGAGFHPNIINNLVEEFAQSPDGILGDKILPEETVSRFVDLNSAGLKQHETIKLMRFLKSGFEDSEAVKNSAVQMYKSGIDIDKITDIIHTLSILNPTTGKAIVSSAAMNSVVNVKNSLSVTRKNDRKEINNPINKLNVQTYHVGTNLVITHKNGELKIIDTSNEENNVHDMEESYENMLKEQEDDICVKFAKKYHDKQGEIDSKYVRVIGNLRRNGISNGQILKLTDFCTIGSIINKNRLNAIKELKTAGALSDDLPEILSAISQDENGDLDTNTVQVACELTDSVIGGKDVALLLPKIQNNEKVKDLIIYLAQFKKDREFLHPIANLLRAPDNSVDENAIDSIYNLAVNFFISEHGSMSEENFAINTEAIINTALTPDTKIVDDEAAGIISIMCRNHESPQNISDGLNICKDKDGFVNSDLAEVLWDLCLDKTSFEDIQKVINSCKTNTGEINSNLAKAIIAFYDSGHKSDEIIAMVDKLHQAE
ncbi:hypothetical protein IJ182_11110 [bacterium]|nr:hypothetical protein [bacterium]